MSKRIISTDKAPAAIGPYSQAVAASGFLFCSGQLPMDPATGELVPGGAAEQAEQALKNLKAVLEGAGASLGDVIKTTCFLADMADFAAFNAVYATYFTADFPARSTFQVAALPKAAKVEIEAVAVLPK